MIHQDNKPPIPKLSEINDALSNAPHQPSFPGETLLVIVKDEMIYMRGEQAYMELGYFERQAMAPMIEFKAREFRRVDRAAGERRLLYWIYTGEFHL